MSSFDPNSNKNHTDVHNPTNEKSQQKFFLFDLFDNKSLIIITLISLHLDFTDTLSSNSTIFKNLIQSIQNNKYPVAATNSTDALSDQMLLNMNSYFLQVQTIVQHLSGFTDTFDRVFSLFVKRLEKDVNVLFLHLSFEFSIFLCFLIMIF